MHCLTTAIQRLKLSFSLIIMGLQKKNGGGYIVLSQLFIYTFSLYLKEIFPKATRRWVSISHFLINLPITHIYFQVVDALNKLKYILSFLDSYG